MRRTIYSNAFRMSGEQWDDTAQAVSVKIILDPPAILIVDGDYQDNTELETSEHALWLFDTECFILKTRDRQYAIPISDIERLL